MTIIPYNTAHAQDFKAINIQWLEDYFYVEPFDLEVLSKPETYIIDKGGHIFFALKNDIVVGTVALMPTKDATVLELTKMAVLSTARGQGIGQQLMAHCLAFARAKTLDKLILYSHRKLENALHIYQKWGFKEVALEENSSYERANIKMEIEIKR